MDSPERYLARLGQEATYGSEAAARLEAALAGQPRPREAARGRAALTAAAFIAISCTAGGVTGAVLEARSEAGFVALLPAGTEASPSAILLGDAG